MKGIHIESLPWSEHDEVEQLLRFDVGIMPLSDDSWTKGKCGFKLVQYMACGIPSVASAVGANKQLLVHGQTGFLVNTLFEWQNALLQLAYSSSLRQYMGKKARQRFEAHYALSVMAPKFVNIVNAFV